MQFFLDGRTASTINLLAQIIMLAALWMGAHYARIKKIRPHHANIQTAVVIANLFFILTIMGVTFYRIVTSGSDLSAHPNRWVMLHVALGVVAELLGIYLVLRMRTKIIPPNLRVKNFKQLMRITLGIWTLAVLVGVVVYASFYLM